MATVQTIPEVESYLERAKVRLAGLPLDEREAALTRARARLDLELELNPALATDPTALERLFASLEEGDLKPPAASLQVSELPPAVGPLGTRRCCKGQVSREAMMCPHCGATSPITRSTSYEWKSEKTLFGLPLVHVAWGRDENGKQRVAKGIVAVGRIAKGVVAVGQVAISGITVGQLSLGLVFSLGQAAFGAVAVGQLAVGLIAVGQFALGLAFAAGLFAAGLKAIGLLKFSLWK